MELNPSSVLFRYGQAAPYVVYHDVQLTTKEHMREVVVINPTWLTELAPHYYETKDRRKQGQQSKKRKARASMLPPENVGILGMLAAEDGHGGRPVLPARGRRRGASTQAPVKRRRPVF